MELSEFKYRGARAMVILHERYMRQFFDVWMEAKSKQIKLPETDDPDYASLETLLVHVLACARMYMTWMCEKLGLPDPEIRIKPGVDVIEAEADDYLEHVLEQWRTPLADVTEKAFYIPTYTSRWKVEYCIDAMLEHAVMHPVRHLFQLEEMMEG